MDVQVEAVAKTAETLNRSESQREVRTSRVAFCGTNLVKLKEAFEAMKRRQEDFILQMQARRCTVQRSNSAAIIVFFFLIHS